MISLRFKPLAQVERMLVPRGEGIVLTSDILHTRRAVVSICTDRGWCIHRISQQLARQVSGDAPPVEVVYSPQGQLYGAWVEEVR